MIMSPFRSSFLNHTNFAGKAVKLRRGVERHHSSIRLKPFQYSGAFFNASLVRNYDQAIASNGDLYRKVFRYALDHGVYLAPSPYETAFISTAHEGADIERACTVLDAAIQSL